MYACVIVNRNGEAAHGECRTKRASLEICDEMQQAGETGESGLAQLAPPVADFRVAR